MILVNAANGNQGKLLVPRLIAAGQQVRACVRTERSGKALRAAGVAEVIVGDIADPDVAARAMDGADKVYYLCPGIHPLEREIGMGWVDRARAAGVKHFVFSSVLHAVLTDLVQHEIKRDVEEHLISAHLEYTILQPAIYMSPKRIGAAFASGTFQAAWSLDRLQSLVAIADIAEVAARVLIDSEAHGAATYELAAPGRYSARDMGAVISQAMGRQIPVEEMTAEAYCEFLFGGREQRDALHELRAVRSLNTRYSSNDFLGNPNVLTWLLGRSPVTFEQMVAAQYAEFEASAARV